MADAPRVPDTTDDSEATREPDPSKQPRRQIGAYRLLQRLGEGGMGDVWLAEQTTPVRRQVALKVIKAGMDTAQVVARFEAERQALALMDHPAIATVFDGGTTPEGRPYFVMEYVKGEPITTYCDRQRLTVAERLELFTRVCEGVQHAHQKGIIHRDLKPSNVLITIQDERPVPKIIDFGVAKATAQHLTERTLFTELGVMVGTPEYMSPEQAEMGGLNIDTRTDVYALGVMLYELLTGALPFDRDELRRAGFLEIQRTIREKEPPRPSTRVGPPGPASTEAAKNRHTEPKRLVSELRGDLDWITMKALEKDRTRRYASASDIAADIQRHLSDRPVLAGPPSLAYTAKKFVHRHRGPVVAALLLLISLVAGLVGTSLMYVTASREKVRAQQKEAEALWQNYVANLAAADSSLRMHEVAEAKRRLAACDPKLRNWEWRYLSHEADSSVAVLRDAGDVPVRAWFVPDGSQILGLTDWPRLLAGFQSALLRWDPAARTLARRQDQQQDVDAASANGERVTDGRSIVDPSSARVVCLLDWGRVPEAQKALQSRPQRISRGPEGELARFDDFHQAVAFNADGTLLATGEGGALPTRFSTSAVGTRERRGRGQSESGTQPRGDCARP
jgi:eukaryotic-like serine/threonine-protein kinase